MRSNQDKLAKRAGVFTGATMLSRILGYVRDSLVANFFGAGAAADAFYAAFRISNLFRRLLGEGALSASFIPIFSEYLEKHGKEKTQRFFNVMFTTLLVLLLIVTALGVLFAPQITRFIAMGFERTPERFDLTVTLTRYMFPFLLFISLAALLTGVLNALHTFFLPALAPAALSVAEIVYLLALAPYMSPAQQVIGLAVSVTAGGFIQFILLVPALLKKGFHLMLAWDLKHEGVRRVEKLMVPATLGISVDQLNAFVDTICASFLAQGSVTALYYSNRVMQLPLALFGIALSQVALPTMSASAARGDVQQVKETLNFALRLTLFMIIPAMCGLMFLGAPVVQLLFERGNFTPEATRMTSWALLFFSLGLFAYAAVKILASAFYAYQNTRIPVMVAAICVGLNIILSLILMGPMGVGGLALATAAASWVNAFLLFILLRKKIGLLGGQRILRCLFRASLASVAMLAFCHMIMKTPGEFYLAVRLGAAIAGGAFVYLATARSLGMEEWAPFWSMLSRQHPLEEE